MRRREEMRTRREKGEKSKRIEQGCGSESAFNFLPGGGIQIPNYL